MITAATLVSLASLAGNSYTTAPIPAFISAAKRDVVLVSVKPLGSPRQEQVAARTQPCGPLRY